MLLHPNRTRIDRLLVHVVGSLYNKNVDIRLRLPLGTGKREAIVPRGLLTRDRKNAGVTVSKVRKMSFASSDGAPCRTCIVRPMNQCKYNFWKEKGLSVHYEIQKYICDVFRIGKRV